MRGATIRWCVLALLVLALVIVPFVLFEAHILQVVKSLLRMGGGRVASASAIFLFLAADVFLPVPSSLLATASGMLLAWPAGASVTWCGLQAGAFVGYVVGRSVGVGAVTRFVGSAELDRAARSHRRWGGLSVVVARAVPVAAESTVLLAGAVRMPFPQFAVLTAASNLAIAVVYAAVGAYALETLEAEIAGHATGQWAVVANALGTRAFLLAFAASVLLPGLAMLAHRAWTKPACANLSERSQSDSVGETETAE